MSDTIGFDSIDEGPSAPLIKGGGNSEITDEDIAALAPDLSDDTVMQNERPPIDPNAKSKPDPTKKEKEVDILGEEDKALDAASKEQKVKTLKLKNGEADLDVRPDALVPTRVNGRIEMISLNELRTNYAGKVGYDEKFSQLDGERKQFYNERDKESGRIDDFYRVAVQEKNPRLAIEGLAEATGSDPKEIWDSIVRPIKQALANLNQLTPEEARAQELESELQHYRSRDDSRRQAETKTRETEGLVTRIKETQDKFGMDGDTFKARYDDMVGEAARTGFDIKNLTPEMVGQYHDIVIKKEGIQTVVADKFSDNPKGQMIAEQLYDTWSKNPEFSLKDISDIAVEVYGAKRPKNAKLIEKTKQQRSQPQVQASEPMDWDDI